MADYVVVGAGSAGCILASRLSENADATVVLVEAGGPDSNILYRMPAGFFALMKSGMGNWKFQTTPQPGLNGRTMYFPRGKVLGGSSSINGQIVHRGVPSDYDGWAALGNSGWSYHECLPYFKRIESFPDGDIDLRGHTGPVGVTAMKRDNLMSLSKTWIEAAEQAGLPFNADYNGMTCFGVSTAQGNYSNAIRQSSSASYLSPAMGRPNLEVVVNALVTRIMVENGRAIGVEILRNGKTEVIRAEREVLLSGGAINSPQILQLSGIGDPHDLEPLGIKVKTALSGVGKNLQDHLSVAIKQRLTAPVSVLRRTRPLAMVSSLIRYGLLKSGPAATNGFETWVHTYSKEGLPDPDLQIYCVNLLHNDHGRDIIQEEGFMAYVNHSRPCSAGTVKLRSAIPTEAPAIDPRYLTDPEDLRTLRVGLRVSRDIIAQKAFDDIRGSEYSPGPATQSDDDLNEHIRNTANTIYHPVGTCKMGTDDLSVVDSTLRVYGVEGLRVVDASIMPTLPSGNTNFPTMMIAERAAEMIANGNLPT